MELEESRIYFLADSKISLGSQLINNLNEFEGVPGIQKIQRKIKQEIKFLEKAKNTKKLTSNNVMCSNLTHYQFLVDVLKKQNEIVHVDCAFTIENREHPIRVDIVCENGAKWVKVIARNSKSISDAAKGGVSFGVKSIIDQGLDYSKAAEQNLHMFKKPQVVFYFSHSIDCELLAELHSFDIITITDQNNDMTVQDNDIDLKCKSSIESNTNILNLDITTMLAYVSSLTNGNCNFIFKEPLLTEQGARERQKPLKPILKKIFEGKKLICCETAMQSFENIINILAGPEEKKRAQKLKSCLEIKPDLQIIPDELSCLNVRGKIKLRSLKIFAFGLVNEAITVTSNAGFVRSSRMKGINFPVFIHEARALTESKECNSTVITDNSP